MQKFKFILELKVGTLQINENQVSERIELNKSFVILNNLEDESEMPNKGSFSLLIDDDQKLEFAAVDNNLFVFNKWLQKLQNVQEQLSNSD